MKCDICEIDVRIDSRYGDGVCTQCDRAYEHEEGTTIRLTDKDFEILRKSDRREGATMTDTTEQHLKRVRDAVVSARMSLYVAGLMLTILQTKMETATRAFDRINDALAKAEPDAGGEGE